MDISIEKLKLKERIAPLFFLIITFLAVALVLHLAAYLLLYRHKFTFIDALANAWMLYAYAALGGIGAQSAYKAKILKVKHNDELDFSKIRLYFINTGYSLMEEGDGKMLFESKKWLDRQFSGSRYVKITYSSSSVQIQLPANLVYHVHHAFKFTSNFLKDTGTDSYKQAIQEE